MKRNMPQDIDAEKALLASIMMDSGQVLPEIIDSVRPEHFYHIGHQAIYSGLTSLFQRNEPIDLVCLTNAMRSSKTLSKAGGATAVSSLLETPIAPNPSQYARIVREKYVLRSLIAASAQIAAKSFESGNAEQVVDFAEKTVFEIAKDKIKPAFFEVGKIMGASLEMIESRANSSDGITGVASGYDDLDRLTSGFQNSDLIIMAARPSMGKTALALNMAQYISREKPVVFFSLEMSKEQLVMRMICGEARIDTSKLRSGELSVDDWDRIHGAANRLSSQLLYIDDTPAQSPLEIRAKCRRLHMKTPLSAVFIDYLQLMRASETAERRDLAIGEISGALKALAKDLNIPVIALSQLNRKLEERQNKRPILSDLRESGSLEQDADLVLFIYRDEVYNKDEANPHKGLAEILLRKQRNGPTGEVTLLFVGGATRFENISKADYVAPY